MNRIKSLLLIILLGGIILMSGCINTPLSNTNYNSNNEVTKSLLKQKYNEDFNVISIRFEGTVWYATCAPVNDPEVVFETRISSGVINEDDYPERKEAKEINEIFKEDLKDFFPNAYFRTYILKTGLYLDIYISETTGTSKQYRQEYIYFTEQVNKYIEEGKMSEVTVMFFKVDDEAIERIAKYYESNASEKGDFYSTVLGVDNYQNGNDNDFLGSPTQISACFKHGMPSFLDNVDEYIRRRELIENE